MANAGEETALQIDRRTKKMQPRNNKQESEKTRTPLSRFRSECFNPAPKHQVMIYTVKFWFGVWVVCHWVFMVGIKYITFKAVRSKIRGKREI